MLEVANQMESLKENLGKLSQALANAVTCNNLVLRTVCGLDDEQYEILNQFVPPVVEDNQSD